MQAVSKILGFVLIAAGLLLAVTSLLMPGQILLGLTFDGGAILVVGGVLSLGLSGVMEALERSGARQTVTDEEFEAASPEAPSPSRASFLGSAVGEPPAREKEPVIPARDTSYAARSAAVIAAASGALPRSGMAAAPPPPPPPPPPPARFEPVVEETPEISEEDLYVVDERVISGKPARILSDGTVEAETDEGWMRFENVEHLQEYLEAMRG